MPRDTSDDATGAVFAASNEAALAALVADMRTYVKRLRSQGATGDANDVERAIEAALAQPAGEPVRCACTECGNCPNLPEELTSRHVLCMLCRNGIHQFLAAAEGKQ